MGAEGAPLERLSADGLPQEGGSALLEPLAPAEALKEDEFITKEFHRTALSVQAGLHIFTSLSRVGGAAFGAGALGGAAGWATAPGQGG